MLMEIAANAGDQEKQNLNSFAIIEPIQNNESKYQLLWNSFE